MAVSDTLFVFTGQARMPPATNPSDISVSNFFVLLDYDDTTSETNYLPDVLGNHYSGSSVTLKLFWTSKTATSGTVRWSLAWERLNAGFDIDATSFATAKTVNTTAPAAAGQVVECEVAFSTTEIDSLLVNEAFRLSATRIVAIGGNMVGDARLIAVEARESIEA